MEDRHGDRAASRGPLLVCFLAILIFAGCAFSPPSLMDDVDAVQAQIARNMLESGDWVTARLNGVAYLEKAPLKYWMMAASMAVFGVHDWAARLPLVLAVIALCWVTAKMGAWAFGARAGTYSGLALVSAVGLFLFTRILIPDAILTLTITVSLWAFLRHLEEDGWKWPLVFWGAQGLGFLLKGLIAMLFPLGAVTVYLLFTGIAFEWRTWARLRPFSGALLVVAIAAPWLVLATLANPPYFDFTMRSAPGEYHGFFWFFFLNEHLFRFLNMRHPRDYNTVPRLAFWLFHLLWLFPFSAFLPAALGERYSASRAARVRLLMLCWTGFLLVFFTFSTTQEYYSLPCYPALAMLIGAAVDRGSRWVAIGARAVGAVAVVLAMVLTALLAMVWNEPAPGDISAALTLNPEAYTLSLGHMSDLTVRAFAYLKLPLAMAAVAFAAGAAGLLLRPLSWAPWVMAAMMALFTHAARVAMVAFDPYLSSRPLAEALASAPPGEVVFDNQYYTFSSVFFYANVKRGWLLNGRVNNLEYGSYAPGAPDVFLDDARFTERWKSDKRHYLLVEGPSLPRIETLVGKPALHPVHSAGGKFLFTNISRN